MVDKWTIARNFSKSAVSYDEHSQIQLECAKKLMSTLERDQFTNILEIGCGTGSYTKMLKNKYKKAKITAIDISEPMIEAARAKLNDKDVYFMLADGEAFTMDGELDLITSNATFQWFENLENTFYRFKHMLRPGGTFCFSMYGPQTFMELGEVFKKHVGEHFALSSMKFSSQNEIIAAVQKNFHNFNLMENFYAMDFFSLWDFLKNIKKSGTRGNGIGKNIFLGKHMIRSLEEEYIKRFGGIVATHHVYFCKAKA